MARLNTGLDKKYMIVSGSNIPEVNGIYQRAGIENGKPFYIKTPAVNAPVSDPPPFPTQYGNLKISIQAMFPTVWALSHVSFVGYFYFGSSNFATPDLVPSWSIGQNGSGGISVKVFSGSISINKQNFGGGKLTFIITTA